MRSLRDDLSLLETLNYLLRNVSTVSSVSRAFSTRASSVSSRS